MRRDKEAPPPHQKLHPGRGKGKCKGPGAGMGWREEGMTAETPRRQVSRISESRPRLSLEQARWLKLIAQEFTSRQSPQSEKLAQHLLLWGYPNSVIPQTIWPSQSGAVTKSLWTRWPDLASKGHFIQKQDENADQIHWKASVGVKWDFLKNPGLLFGLSSWIQMEEALVTKGWHMDGFLLWLTDLVYISLITSYTYPVTHRY